MQPEKENIITKAAAKQAKPYLYTPDELDRADKEMARKLKDADQTLANAQLQEIQERGIDSHGETSNGHIDSIFFNHKIVQSPEHKTRRTILAVVFVVFLLYFLMWAMGIFALPGLNI